MIELTLVQWGILFLSFALGLAFLITLIAEKFFKFMTIIGVVLFIASLLFPVQASDLFNVITGVL